MPAIVRQYELEGHRSSIYALAQGPTDQSFYAAGSEGEIVEWRPEESPHGRLIASVPAPLFTLFYDRQHQWLMAGSMAGELLVIDIARQSILFRTRAHQGAIYQVTFHGHQMFAVSKDGTVSVWEPGAEARLLHRIRFDHEGLRCLAFHPTESWFAVAGSAGRIYLYDFTQGQVMAEYTGPTASVFSMCFSADGRTLFAGSRDACLYCFSLSSKQLLQRINAHWYTINALTTILHETYLVSASRDKTIRIWDVERLVLLHSLTNESHGGHTRSVNTLLWLPTAQWLVTAGDDRRILVWKIEHNSSHWQPKSTKNDIV